VPYDAEIWNLNADDIEDSRFLKDALLRHFTESELLIGVIMESPQKKVEKTSLLFNLKVQAGTAIQEHFPEYKRVTGRAVLIHWTWESTRQW